MKRDDLLKVRTKGILLPYRIFSKHQRVSHDAAVENKRFGHALAVIKAQGDTYFVNPDDLDEYLIFRL